jgi:hypothetical protein
VRTPDDEYFAGEEVYTPYARASLTNAAKRWASASLKWVIGQPNLAAGEADREPPGARTEGRDRIDQGRDGIASSESCHA